MNTIAVIAVSITVGSLSGIRAAQAQVLEETFPDPLGGWTTRWLYQNSNLENYYVAGGNTVDPDFRGNNPAGLWFADTQGFNSGVGGNISTIVFNPAFAASLTAIQFDLSAFIPQSLTIRDKDGATLLFVSSVVQTFDVNNGETYGVLSGNGIGSITFETAQGNQIEGNTGIDNVIVTLNGGSAAPEPGTLALLTLGAGVAGIARRRRAR